MWLSATPLGNDRGEITDQASKWRRVRWSAAEFRGFGGRAVIGRVRLGGWSRLRAERRWSTLPGSNRSAWTCRLL